MDATILMLRQPRIMGLWAVLAAIVLLIAYPNMLYTNPVAHNNNNQ